jgi:two-component system CheB/CheR fusion protein
VEDTGRGIPPEFLPFLFDMFRQANTGTTRQYGGFGIGLALVKEQGTSHGGEVEVHSEGRDKGALFRILLPMLNQELSVVPSMLADSRNLAGKSILLVDYDKDVLESLIFLLDCLEDIAAPPQNLQVLSGDYKHLNSNAGIHLECL